MRKVLFVSVCFPPLAEIGSQRPARLCRHLPDHGWQPTVLTVSERCAFPYDPTLMDLVPAGLPVFRCPCRSWLAHTYDYRRRVSSKWKRLIRLPAHVIAYAKERHAEPDAYRWWRTGAVRLGVELHSRFHFDLVAGTLNPWTVGLVVHDIAKRCKLPFVLDYRDPWSLQTEHDKFTSPVRKAREREVERRLLADAAAVTAVTPGIRDLYEQGFPDEAAGKLHVVTNSFDPGEWTDVEPQPFDRFTILHGGNIHATRSLKPMMRGLAELARRGTVARNELQLMSYGAISDDERGFATQLGIDHWVRFEKMIPRQRFVRLLRGAQILLVTERWPFVVPGKTLDYLAANNPILAITPRASQIAALIRDSQGGVVFEEAESGQIATFLELALVNFRAGRPILTVADPLARMQFSTPYTSRQMAAVFDTVVGVRAATRAQVAPVP